MHSNKKKKTCQNSKSQTYFLYPNFVFKCFTTRVFPPDSEVGSLLSKPAKQPNSKR